MPLIEVDGGPLGYDVHRPVSAAAPAVLLLHGLGSAAEDWAPQIAALGDTYRLITLDLRGHGRSRRTGRFTIDGAAADVDTLLRRLGEDTVHIVGLSLGGCVALALALRAPERVRSLVLVNTFARIAPAGARGALRMLGRLALLAIAPMPTLAAYVARDLFPKPAQHALYRNAVARLAGNRRRDYLAAVRALARFDVRRRLGEIRCPTLVVAGDRDTTVPLAAKHALVRGIPGARLVVVADSGHVTPWDRPAEFNRTLDAFLQERGPTRE